METILILRELQAIRTLLEKILACAESSKKEENNGNHPK